MTTVNRATEWARRWTGRARAAAGVARKSIGLLEGSPRGALELARQRLAGPLGLPSLLRVHARARPDAPALIGDDETRTFRALDRRVDQLAHVLRSDLGLRPGDAGLLVLENRPEVLEAQAALARIGASAIPVSWRSTAGELAYLAEHSGARAAIVEASLVDRVPLPASRLLVVGSEAGGSEAGGSEAGAASGALAYDDAVARAPAAPIDGHEGAVVIYTSGTTGRPKGAVRRFPEEMVWAMLHVLDELPVRSDDRHLAVCPMYHTTAFGFIGFTFVLGGAVVIARRFDPEAFLATIERHRITTTAVVPTMLSRVLALPPEVRRRYDTRSLRAVFTAGAPLPGELASRVIGELGHVLYNIYGSTETGLNTLATPAELLRAPGTIGHPLRENDVRLLDAQGREVDPGETGELFVKNAMLVAGYHQDEAATRASMRGGYFSVGDLAHRDEHGLLHLDGRKRDMIITGGVNVYPAEIEEALHRHPNVAECAVVGVADPDLGERVRACVVPRTPPLDEEDVLTFARERLAGPKRPREVVVMDALPKNPTGKVLKRTLREAAGQDASGDAS